MIEELSEIDETTTFEERQEVYIGLIEMGWSDEECVAVTGLEWSIVPVCRDGRIVEPVPSQGGMQ